MSNAGQKRWVWFRGAPWANQANRPIQIIKLQIVQKLWHHIVFIGDALKALYSVFYNVDNN